MHFYLEEPYFEDALTQAAAVKSEDYYVNMMIAWFFATALYKNFDLACSYLVEGRLPAKVHNMAIRKAMESFRINSRQKDFLRTLRIKPKKG